MNGPNKLESFVPGRPFQITLMFASKAEAYPSRTIPGASEKHSSLFDR